MDDQEWPAWQKDTLRVRIAEKIVGPIYNQSNFSVGPVMLAVRARGLKLADQIIGMVVDDQIKKGAYAPREVGIRITRASENSV